MATAKKLPSGNWRVRASKVVNGNKTVKSFTANTKKAAELLGIQWQNNNKVVSKNNKTLKKGIDDNISSIKNIRSAWTIETYKKYQRLYFKKLQSKKMSDICSIDIQNEVNQMALTLSPKTIKSSVMFISSVLMLNNNDVSKDINFLQSIRKPVIPYLLTILRVY